MDTFTEVTHRNVFQRFGRSVKAIVFGGVLFAGAFPLLFINEGCAVKDYKRLGEACAAAIEVPSTEVTPNNDGQLLVVSGMAATDEEVVDPQFNISAQAIRLERKAEMYQWDEKTSTRNKKKLGGGETTETEYRYEKTWSDDLISSSDFKHPQGHDNPRQMPVASATFQANRVTLGAFQLNDQLVSRIHNDHDIPLTDTDLTQVPEPMRQRVKMHQGEFYLGNNPDSPVIGDVRVQFEKVLPAEVTVRAAQQGASSFAPWASSSGAQVHEIRMGVLSATQMHEKAMTAAKARTWLARLGGFIAMGIGLSIILGPLAVVADVVPFFGNLVRTGAGVVAFMIAAVLSLVVIAIAWFTYRPMVSVPLLIGAGAICWWVMKRGKTKASTPPPLRHEHEQPPPLSS